MRVSGGALAALVTALVAATTASAADPDPTLYCVGDGGPLGVATDIEHTVLLGDPKPPAGVTERHISVAGGATRVIEAGPPEAKAAVVFVHGNPGSARDWDDLVAANGRFARTVAFDIPGWGKSDKENAQIHTTDGAAAYIQRVLDQLGIRRVVLVAHDFGGIWGLQWASQHPGALIGAVLIDTGVLKDYVPHPLALVWATNGAGEAQVASTTRDSFRQAVQFMQPRPLPLSFVDRMYDDYDRLTRCALLRYYRSMRDLTFGNPNAVADKQIAALGKRKRPALVIWGAKDPYIPQEQAYKQRAAFPGARVEIFEDSAHWPFVDNATRTRALVVPFLRPKLSATLGSVGRRRVQVRVRVTGVLAAQRVTASLAGASTKPVSLLGARTLSIRLPGPLAAGSHTVTVRAFGLPAKRLKLKVAAPRRTESGRHSPRDPEDR